MPAMTVGPAKRTNAAPSAKAAILGVALLLACVLAGTARAESCPAPAGAAPALADVDAGTRLAWIDARLARTAHRSNVWLWGWGVGLVAATAANLAPVPWVKHDVRIDLYTGAVTTIVGVVPLLLFPPAVIADSRTLHGRIAALPPGASRCGLLADAERLLPRDADNETLGRSWWAHVANVALNGGVGLFLVLGYHHWTAGILNLVGGSAVGELIIYTQPVDTVADLDRYRRAELATAAPAPVAWMVAPLLGTRGEAGLQLALRF